MVTYRFTKLDKDNHWKSECLSKGLERMKLISWDYDAIREKIKELPVGGYFDETI